MCTLTVRLQGILGAEEKFFYHLDTIQLKFVSIKL